MKKETDGEMREEYTAIDLGEGVRGKYYESYQESRNIVRLDPEVAQAFPDDASVNEALMALIRVARASASGKSNPHSESS